MYREIQRTNGMTETTIYALDNAQRVINERENADVPQANSAVTRDQPEALVAAVSFAALLLILLVSVLQAWL